MNYNYFIYFNILLLVGYLTVTFKDALKGKQQQKKYNKNDDKNADKKGFYKFAFAIFVIPILGLLTDIFLLKKFNMKLFMGSQLISYAWFFFIGFWWLLMSLAGGNF